MYVSVMIGLQILGTPDDTVVLIQVEPIMLLHEAGSIMLLMVLDELGDSFMDVWTGINSTMFCVIILFEYTCIDSEVTLELCKSDGEQGILAIGSKGYYTIINTNTLLVAY